MIFLEEVGEVYLYRGITDMRKNINGLVVMVEEVVNQNPGSGALFVFLNRGRDKIKILFWQINGFCLFYKRLEKDRFLIPKRTLETQKITVRELRWLLEGLSFEEVEGHASVRYDIYQ